MQVWHTFNPDLPADLVFVDQLFEALYAQDQQQVQLLSLFSLLALLIALLGIVGLLAYMGQRRMKEVALRRVLGARFGHVMLLLGRHLLLIVMLAALIAVPLSWFLLDAWLGTFAYREEQSLLPYAGAGIIVLLLIVMSICWQGLRMLRVNPAELLNAE